MNEFYDQLETRSHDERAAAQLGALRAQLTHVTQNTSAYADAFREIDIDSITDLEAFSRIPLTRKSELIALQVEQRPFGGFTPQNGPLPSHVFASPGPIYEPGFAVTDFWRFARSLYASGVRSGYVGTPSFLKIILEQAEALGSDVSCINKAMVSGEALPGPLRDGFSARGLRVQQCYGTADLGLIAYESSALEGLIIDEGVYVEIVRPGTGEPVSDGEVGEVVVTNLGAEYPLIRFATGDLSASLPGISPCGRSNMRIRGWMGRADQTAKVRGMFIHPEQVDRVVKRHVEIERARLVVDWIDQTDRITLQCECTAPDSSLPAAIEASIRSICKLRGAVEIVTPGSLPNDGKVIDDIRQYD